MESVSGLVLCGTESTQGGEGKPRVLLGESAREVARLRLRVK